VPQESSAPHSLLHIPHLRHDYLQTKPLKADPVTIAVATASHAVRAAASNQKSWLKLEICRALNWSLLLLHLRFLINILDGHLRLLLFFIYVRAIA
jgi:hypothetical protein